MTCPCLPHDSRDASGAIAAEWGRSGESGPSVARGGTYSMAGLLARVTAAEAASVASRSAAVLRCE